VLQAGAALEQEQGSAAIIDGALKCGLGIFGATTRGEGCPDKESLFGAVGAASVTTWAVVCSCSAEPTEVHSLP